MSLIGPILFFLALYLFLQVSILLHELGHLFAGLFVGWTPVSITVGRGRSHKLLTLGQLDFLFGPWPFGGLALSLATTSRQFRLRSFFVVSAGPLVSLGLAFFFYWLYDAGENNAAIIPWRGLIWIFFLLESLMVIENIIPHHVHIYGTKLPNDGLKLFTLLAAKQDELSTIYAVHAAILSKRALLEGKVEQSFVEAEKAFLMGRANAGNLANRICWIHFLIECGSHDIAKIEREKLLASDDRLSESRAVVLDNLACLPFYYGHPELLAEAMGYIDQAIELEPDTITFKGTKASLLIETGAIAEGLAMIEDVQKKSDAPMDQQISAYYRALAHSKLGENEKARVLLQETRRKYPTCIVGPRIAAEVLRYPL